MQLFQQATVDAVHLEQVQLEGVVDRQVGGDPEGELSGVVRKVL